MKHEMWVDAEGMPGLCLAGPMGDGFRALQGDGARVVATIEASSHFEAMMKYNAILGRGPYTREFEVDCETYPGEWRAIQDNDSLGASHDER
ncbi:MAG: hypothetical protein ACXWLN_16925 [Thermoanaerobaculia bacterium]